MKQILIAALLLVFVGCESRESTPKPQPKKAVPGLTAQGQAVEQALFEGKKCTATFSEDSDNPGQKTQIFGVRVEPSERKTQYQVYYDSEFPRLWVWDFRLKDIECK